MYLDILEWLDRLLLLVTLTAAAGIAIGVSAYFDVPYTARLWWLIQRGLHGLL